MISAKKIMLVLFLLGFYLAASALADGPGYGRDSETGKPRLVLCKNEAPFTCDYHGKMTFSCKRILNKTAVILKTNPTATVPSEKQNK
jgi:hypothetical protein